jgi:RNA polymerase subunit RPABC4/transcription elongation factor Spt4
MALDLTCPTCRSENTQRLTIMKSQQSFTGSAGQTALAAHLKPPAKPWGLALVFVIGMGALAMAVAIALWTRNPLPVIPVLAIWIAAGLWMRKTYQHTLREWERYLDAHFICLRCGALFKPSREVPGGSSAVKVCLSSACARQIPREAKTCPYCGLTQVPRLAKA